MDVLGIDIGTVSVKYVRMRGKNLLSQGDYAHKGGWEDLNFILTEIKDEEGTDVEVAIAVSSSEILKKTFTIPIIPKEEAKEAIEWSASKVVSTPLENMIYENVRLGEITERGMKKEEILFVGVEREYVNILLSVFENVGFRRIRAITDTGLLYLHVAAHKKEGSMAVVDIGGRQTGIYVFDDKRLKFVREIMTASESFIDALMGELNLSYDEAEQSIIEKGFNEESSRILASPLDRLTGEIQRTFNVYARKYPERPITGIHVTGRASSIPNLVDKMKEAFIEEVDALTPSSEIEHHFLPAYMLCLNTEPLVNLLPERLKAKRWEMTLKSWVRVAAMAVVALLLVPSIGMFTNFRKLQVAVRMEQADVASKKDQLKALASITTDSRYGELIVVGKEIERKDQTFVALMKYFSSRLPKDVYLREITFTDRNREFGLAAREPTKEAVPTANATAPAPVKKVAHDNLPQGGTSAPLHAQAAGQGKTGTHEPDYGITLRGHIFGDVDVLEPVLLGLVINLERSTLFRNVDVTKREVKELRGRKALEFTINARCSGHEV